MAGCCAEERLLNIATNIAIFQYSNLDDTTCMLHTLTAVADVGRYPSDDINKFLWMVRIGGGEFPEIKERDYIGDGSYRVDNKVTKVWRPVPAASARANPT